MVQKNEGFSRPPTMVYFRCEKRLYLVQKIGLHNQSIHLIQTNEFAA